ncbi:hypothetical protein [Marinobacter sp. LN3S78]|uniref:hypothetical protein n=1 Tax=Marinobacter sp. LN3S78 TaxID=3382300 RepID=UPI00387B5AAF
MTERSHRQPFIFSLMLSVIAINGCDSGNQLAADAKALCDAFDPEHLKSEYEGMWLSDAEKAIYANLAESIETDEVKAVIAGRSGIDNYAQVYPAIKERMEDALGASWNCQDMASFYDIDFTPSSEQEDVSVLEAQQVDGPVLQIDDVEIDFSDAQSSCRCPQR